jgi:hypothetical protein
MAEQSRAAPKASRVGRDRRPISPARPSELRPAAAALYCRVRCSAAAACAPARHAHLETRRRRARERRVLPQHVRRPRVPARRRHTALQAARSAACRPRRRRPRRSCRPVKRSSRADAEAWFRAGIVTIRCESCEWGAAGFAEAGYPCSGSRSAGWSVLTNQTTCAHTRAHTRTVAGARAHTHAKRAHARMGVRYRAACCVLHAALYMLRAACCILTPAREREEVAVQAGAPWWHCSARSAPRPRRGARTRRSASTCRRMCARPPVTYNVQRARARACAAHTHREGVAALRDRATLQQRAMWLAACSMQHATCNARRAT